MLIRQKAGWRLHHQAYLWPKRYKSSPSSAISLGLSPQTAEFSLTLNTLSSSLSSSSKRKRTTASGLTKRASGSASSRQHREREAAKRRLSRASRTLSTTIPSRRISSNGSDGVPSPTSPSSSSSSSLSSSSSISSSSSPSPRKLSRGHLELPWFLGSGPCMLKPWEEPFLDSSDEEDNEETIAIRLRRHTRKRRSSGHEQDSNIVTSAASSLPSQKPAVVPARAESAGQVAEGIHHGVNTDPEGQLTVEAVLSGCDSEADTQDSEATR
ncbi:hypothetical protein ElyMa_000764100 [Elysia marginata]|uniref:Uncharacterized protein n=1 Tax=Elysia marginata TaxID=1093978 RepID=A0AAV4GQN0_9GAST|nr:hypothetical protein ElyMa_000764100 [Elysia marginata]